LPREEGRGGRDVCSEDEMEMTFKKERKGKEHCKK